MSANRSMEVLVRSMEMVKPSKANAGEVEQELRRPPFKLCLLDQLVPPYYTPLILFYPMANKSSWSPKMMSKKLKESLSHTLTSFYPLSGRIKDNVIVDDFEAGVPFIETRVQGHCLSEFLNPPKLEFLNKLLPVETFCRHSTTEPQQSLPPLLIVQMNTFDCDGIAIGLWFSHQIMDGATKSAFLKAWAAHSRQLTMPIANQVVCLPTEELSGGNSTFPPLPSGVPPQFVPLINKSWFPVDKDCATTRRFVISNDAIATLKSRAMGTSINNPTRTEAILAFIWKSMLAAAITSKSPKPLCLRQPVNLRPRMKKKNSHDLIFSGHSIGNLFSVAVSFCDYCDDDDVDNIGTSINNSYLAGLIRGGLARMLDDKYLSVLSSDQGFEMIAEGIKQLQGTNVAILSCSSWLGFGFSEVDFGWGTPIWSGVAGDASGNNPSSTNLVILKELAPKDEENNGIEIWIRVDPILMTSLQNNPQFLEFASPNPPVVLF